MQRMVSSRDFEKLLWEDQSVPVKGPKFVDVLLKVQEAQDKLSSETASDHVVHKLSPEKEKEPEEGNSSL